MNAIIGRLAADSAGDDGKLLGAILFMGAFGGVEIQLVEGTYENSPTAAASTSLVARGPVIFLYTTPEDAEGNPHDIVHNEENIVHEFGHALVLKYGANESDLFLEWNGIQILISDFDTDEGWKDGDFDKLQNRSTLDDVVAGRLTRGELENERIANMFEAWVYEREPDTENSDNRSRRAAWAMWTFMTGQCPPDDVLIDLQGNKRPCGSGFFDWIKEYGGN